MSEAAKDYLVAALAGLLIMVTAGAMLHAYFHQNSTSPMSAGSTPLCRTPEAAMPWMAPYTFSPCKWWPTQVDV